MKPRFNEGDEVKVVGPSHTNTSGTVLSLYQVNDRVWDCLIRLDTGQTEWFRESNLVRWSRRF